MRSSDIIGNLKENIKLKWKACADQQSDIPDDCSCIEYNGQSLGIVEKFWYPVGTIKKKTLWPLFMDGVQLPQG